ncbi:hypothetical protein [Streptomyces sp. NPDC059564]|uniref:hypothetical protein n=1 Tax=Streptomyces sp. NPDC059564 TaxID=3346865 RepID=UPI0036A06EAA
MGTESAPRRGFWAAGLANLALGVPAVVPLYLLWWVATEYLPMDCHTTADLADPGLGNCDFHTLDHAPVVMFLLVVTGVLLLGTVLVVDAVLPAKERRPVWLRSAALIPVPFGMLLALATFATH